MVVAGVVVEEAVGAAGEVVVEEEPLAWRRSSFAPLGWSLPPLQGWVAASKETPFSILTPCPWLRGAPCEALPSPQTQHEGPTFLP